MGKRPSNTLFYVLLSIIAIFGLYIVGGFILDARQDESIESRRLVSRTHGY
jgi:hypothetical protein